MVWEKKKLYFLYTLEQGGATGIGAALQLKYPWFDPELGFLSAQGFVCFFLAIWISCGFPGF